MAVQTVLLKDTSFFKLLKVYQTYVAILGLQNEMKKRCHFISLTNKKKQNVLQL